MTRFDVQGGGGEIVAGDTDATKNTGTDTHSQDGAVLVLDRKDLGTGTSSFDGSTVAPTLATGTLTEQDADTTATGTGTRSTGTDTHAADDLLAALSAQIVGTVTDSMAADGSIVTTAEPTAHSITQNWNGGSGNNNNDWVNVTNAYREALANATISAAATISNPDGFEDQIKFRGFEIDGAIPSGWSRDLVELVVRWAHDFTFDHALAGHDRLVIDLRKSTGVLVVNKFDQSNIDATRFMTETRFDITAAVNFLTEAEIEGLEVWFGADANLPIAAGDASVTLDFVRIDTTFTRTGIT